MASKNTIKNTATIDSITARKAPASTGTPDQLAPFLKDARNRQEALIDEALEESMDASDVPTPKQIH